MPPCKMTGFHIESGDSNIALPGSTGRKRRKGMKTNHPSSTAAGLGLDPDMIVDVPDPDPLLPVFPPIQNSFDADQHYGQAELAQPAVPDPEVLPDAAQNLFTEVPPSAFTDVEVPVGFIDEPPPPVDGSGTADEDSTIQDPISLIMGLYIQALYRLDAPSTSIAECGNPSCINDVEKHGPADGLYRCKECFDMRQFCKTCCLAVHQTLPFHRPKLWKVNRFEKVPLRDLGLVFNLGHYGAPCTSRLQVDPKTLTIVDVSGIHHVDVRFCTCPNAEDPEMQLFSVRLFPATRLRPRTAFTFNLLDPFRIFNLVSKTAANDYLKSLTTLTDAVTPWLVPDPKDQFHFVVRLWRQLKTVRRAGLTSNEPTLPGELAVKCPAYPAPGFNLPDGWESDPDGHLLYGLFLSGDGNFKLQRRSKRSALRLYTAAASTFKDSLFGDGGFWAPQSENDKYLMDANPAQDLQNKGECNTLAGDPDKTATKFVRLAVTGVYGVCCRHTLVMPNGVIDFPKGEGYRNVDVVVAAVLRAAFALGLFNIVFSYNIACKYSINFIQRVMEGTVTLLDPELKDLLLAIVWLIGKFHIGSHQKSCSEKYSFNYTWGVGRMSGELVETIWAEFNWIFSDAFNQFNFAKSINMVNHVQRLYSEASRETYIAEERLEDIERTIGVEGVAKLEADSALRGAEQYQPDPSMTQGPTRTKVLQELHEQEESLGISNDPEIEYSADGALPSAITWVDNGLSLERSQIKYREAAGAVAANDLPDLAATVERTKTKLENSLVNHYTTLKRLAPQLSTVPGMILSPEDAHTDPILLPSRIDVAASGKKLGALAH